MKERRLTRYPFEGYYTNSPSFHSGIHRYQLFLYPVDEKSGLENTSITYSRYLYCTHNKIKLADDIHVDHIDGDRTNHRLENLRVLCPNCHSQTDSYNRKNFIFSEYSFLLFVKNKINS
jgi:hypothetical protein